MTSFSEKYINFLFPAVSDAHGETVGYGSQFGNPLIRRIPHQQTSLDQLFPHSADTPAVLSVQLHHTVWRDKHNKHRYYAVVDGKIRTFLTHEKDQLLQGLSLLERDLLHKQAPVAASLLAIMVAHSLFPAVSWALPTGESVRAGNVTFDRNGKVMTINSGSNKAIVNYNTFNIASDETVNMNLPSSSAAILNRVVGGSPSEILGNLNSNGNVFLVNPSGIVFGADSQVNVGSITASTLNISDQDFLDGNYRFTQDPGVNPAAVVNEGTIQTAPGGYVVLAGGQVTNAGNIYAPGGTVDLAVGSEMQVNVDQDVAVRVQVDEELEESVDTYQDAIQNTDTGAIIAQHINAQAQLQGELYETAVNNQGRIEATAVSFDDSGTITFHGEGTGGGGTIVNEGDLIATNGFDHGTGGDITLQGEEVFLWPGGSVDVSADGLNGSGGTVDITSTGMTRIDHELLAFGSATGGSITVDSGAHLDLSGTMLAEGAIQGGNVSLSAQRPMMANASHSISINGGTAGNIDLVAPSILSSGTYTAISSNDVGGNIDMGGSIALLGATVDASGETGGGRIRIGGEFQGGIHLAPDTDEVVNAFTTLIGVGTELKAATLATTVLVGKSLCGLTIPPTSMAPLMPGRAH